MYQTVKTNPMPCMMVTNFFEMRLWGLGYTYQIMLVGYDGKSHQDKNYFNRPKCDCTGQCSL
jgi:hypothetical protein